MRHLTPADVTIAVIPTVAALTIRHFKHAKDEAGESDLEPKHPAVKFLLDAWNEGNFGDAHEHIAPDCEVYTNGLALEGEHAGPAMVREAVESWRSMVPDLTMELAQEVGDEHRIAIEFRITGTHTGEAPEVAASGGAIDVEGSAFLTLRDDKIVEAWTVFDSLALAVQMGATQSMPTPSTSPPFVLGKPFGRRHGVVLMDQSSWDDTLVDVGPEALPRGCRLISVLEGQAPKAFPGEDLKRGVEPSALTIPAAP